MNTGDKHSRACRYALIGASLSHSFSKSYFEQKFRQLHSDDTYSLVELDSLERLWQAVAGLDGFNVTIPYKQAILPLLDSLDPVAAEVGAVNVVKVLRSASKTVLRGYNTDSPAFLRTLTPMADPDIHSALILGTGGAAQAVAWALRKLGIQYSFVSRNPHGTNQITYDEAYLAAPGRELIVNATPVGTSPDVDSSPWQRQELLTPRHICYDLVYNPAPSAFLRQASAAGARTADGLAMLHLQADLAFQIWQSADN